MGGVVSARTDRERARSAADRRLAVADERLRDVEVALKCFAERLGITETAERIGKSYSVAWQLRVWLGVQSSKRESRMNAEQRNAVVALGAARIRYARALLEIAREAEIESMLIWLGLQTGRQWKATGRRTGRLKTKAALVEVRP